MTALATVATMSLLVLARSRGAGPYGVAAVPVLLAYFLVCGLVTRRAVRAALRWTFRPLAFLASLVAAPLAVVGSAVTWQSRSSAQSLLPPLLAWAAIAGVVWAVAAPAGERRAAVVTGLASSLVWLLGVVVDG